MIQRNQYLDQLAQWRDKHIIKVVTGVRRSGKSTLFNLFIKRLQSEGVRSDQIIHVNLEDLEHVELLEYMALYKYVKARLLPGQKTYVFLDEVQGCRNFEKVVDSLFLDPLVDIYITGSNAFMLSGELATLLSGRYVTMEVLPLSFSEYCLGHAQSSKESQEKFNDFLQNGGFPFLLEVETNNEKAIREYLTGIYNTILVKDIATREGIRDISLLERIVRFIASSAGSPISTKKITDTLISSGRKVSVNTVESYLKALTDSYIVYKADRYDVRGREYLKTLGKYYLVDTGLRNVITADKGRDIGHLIENVVFLELLRRGYKVNVGKLDDKEVDFVATSSEGTIYIQVAATVLDSETLRRELTPFIKIQDNFPKLLLTLDRIGAGNDHLGIRQYNLIDWLLNK